MYYVCIYIYIYNVVHKPSFGIVAEHSRNKIIHKLPKEIKNCHSLNQCINVKLTTLCISHFNNIHQAIMIARRFTICLLDGVCNTCYLHRLNHAN